MHATKAIVRVVAVGNGGRVTVMVPSLQLRCGHVEVETVAFGVAERKVVASSQIADHFVVVDRLVEESVDVAVGQLVVDGKLSAPGIVAETAPGIVAETEAGIEAEAGIVAGMAEFFDSTGIHRQSGQLTDTNLNHNFLMMGCTPIGFGKLGLKFVLVEF